MTNRPPLKSPPGPGYFKTPELDWMLHIVHAIAEETAVTRERLMTEVWDEHWFGSTKTLDVTMASLRRKLGEAAGVSSRITALRGVGYRFERP